MSTQQIIESWEAGVEPYNATRKVTVSAYQHDMEASNVQFVRNEGEDAERTADLLKQCGYKVEIYPILSGGGNDDARLCAAPRGKTIKRTVISPSPAQFPTA